MSPISMSSAYGARSFKTVTFPYPLGIAGGVVKTVEQARKFLAADIPFEWGSFTSDHSPGNGGRDYHAEYVNGSLLYTINSIGLTNPGFAYAREHAAELCKRASDNGRTFWINVSGHSVEDTRELVLRALDAGFRLITVNGSCPNRPSTTTPAKQSNIPILCFDKDAVSNLFEQLGRALGDTSAVILWKVSNGMPRVELMHNINEVAQCKALSGIVTGNTVPDAYDILPNGQPAIHTGNGLVRGGMGGPAVFPLALSATDLAAKPLLDANKIVVSTGGVSSSIEVRGFISRGAFMTQVNSAFREANEEPSFITDIATDLMMSG